MICPKLCNSNQKKSRRTNSTPGQKENVYPWFWDELSLQTEMYIWSKVFVEALVLDGNYRVFTTDGTAASQTTIHIAQWEMHRIYSITVIEENMIWYECRRKDDVRVLMRPCQQSILAERRGWVSLDILVWWVGGKEGETTAWTAIWQLMLHLWHLSRTLVLWRNIVFAQWKSYKSSPAPLKSETAMSYGAEAPSPQRESSYKWKKRLGPESQHVETDRQGQHHEDNPAFQMTPRWQLRVGPWLCWSTYYIVTRVYSIE